MILWFCWYAFISSTVFVTFNLPLMPDFFSGLIQQILAVISEKPVCAVPNFCVFDSFHFWAVFWSFIIVISVCLHLEHDLKEKFCVNIFK